MGMGLVKSLKTHIQSNAERVPFVPRNDFLKNLAGTYIINSQVDVPNWIYDCIRAAGHDPEIVTKTGMIGKIKVSKWLSRFLPDAEASKIYQRYFQSKTYQVELSVRFKDILRMSDSKIFDSCLQSGRERENSKINLLINPNVALLLVRDKAGFIEWRCIVVSPVCNSIPYLCIIPDSVYGHGYGPQIGDIVRELKGQLGDTIVDVSNSPIAPLSPINRKHLPNRAYSPPRGEYMHLVLACRTV